MSSTEAPRRLEWVKSSYSGGDGGQCVEWAPAHAAATGEFLVRDSKVQEALTSCCRGRVSPAWLPLPRRTADVPC